MKFPLKFITNYCDLMPTVPFFKLQILVYFSKIPQNTFFSSRKQTKMKNKQNEAKILFFHTQKYFFLFCKRLAFLGIH